MAITHGSVFLRVYLMVVVLFFFLPHKSLCQNLPDEKIVNFSLPEVSLDSAFQALSRNTGVNISYSPQDLPPEIRVTIVANYLSLGIVIEDILSSTNLQYQIIGSQLVIFKNPETLINKKARISGFVQDVTSGERVVYANVFTEDYKYGTYTNEYGYFALDIPVGENILLFSYLGYDKTIKYVDIYQDTSIVAELNSNILLNEVIIIGKIPKKARDMDISDQLPLQHIDNLPNLAGEPDILRLAQTRPGVVSSADGLGGLVIRGGSVDQNLILYDGVPVYNTGHAMGIFSIFNSSVVKSANLIKGGYPARYGGRLSSVLDVRTREGNNKEFAADISVSPITARATVEGPIKKEKSSFIVSARRTIVDPWLKPISQFQFEINNEIGFIDYYFYDFSAKANFQIGKNDHVYFSGHMSKDVFRTQTSKSEENNNQSITELSKTNWDWGNNLATVRWNHIYSNKLFSNLTLSYSEFDFEFFDFDKTTIGGGSQQSAVGYLASLFNSDVTDLIGNLDFEYRISSKWTLAFGGNFTHHDFRPGVIFSSTRDDLLGDREFLVPGDLTDKFISPRIKGKEVRSYVENEFQLFPWLKANIGAHFSLIQTENQKSYQSFQPRGLVKINFAEKVALKASYSKMDQFLHLLSNTGIGLPNDVWIPSTSEIPPQESEQYSAEFNFPASQKINVIVGGYYKQMTNLRTFKDGALFGIREGTEWQDELPAGSGESYGLELGLEKRIGKYSGWVNYTWAK